MRSAARKASASIVMVGWPRPEVTRLLPSQRKRFLTSCVRWSALITDVFASFPMRQVPRRCTPNCCSRAGSVKKLVRARKQPIPKLQIIRMILVRKAQRGQAPCVFQIRIQREAVVFNRQRCPVAENLHRAVEILRQGRLEILSPARRSGRESAEGKADWREIETSIKPAPAAEPHFLRIKLVEIVQ